VGFNNLPQQWFQVPQLNADLTTCLVDSSNAVDEAPTCSVLLPCGCVESLRCEGNRWSVSGECPMCTWVRRPGGIERGRGLVP
jgi:hypothetical protein